MRRTASILVAVALAAALFVPATGAAQPHRSVGPTLKKVTGTWSWVNTTMEIWKETKKGVIFVSGTEAGTWTGALEGSSVDGFGAKIWPDGRLWALLDISFQGSVDGKTGTLQILTTAVQAEPDQLMSGEWTITSGTGELANYRGQGTWVYAGPDPDHATYTGMIREYVPPA